MAQEVKALTAKLYALTLILRIQMLERNSF